MRALFWPALPDSNYLIDNDLWMLLQQTLSPAHSLQHPQHQQQTIGPFRFSSIEISKLCFRRGGDLGLLFQLIANCLYAILLTIFKND